MGIFADNIPHGHIPAGATIHITNPDKRRNHVRNIFGDTSVPINYRDRSRSVSVCLVQSEQTVGQMKGQTREQTTKLTNGQTTEQTNNRTKLRRHSHCVILRPSTQPELHDLVLTNSCATRSVRDRNKVRTWVSNNCYSTMVNFLFFRLQSPVANIYNQQFPGISLWKGIWELSFDTRVLVWKW